MAAHALIFDLDGTVWDSADWFASALANDNPKALSSISTDLRGDGNIVAWLKDTGVTRSRLIQEAQLRNGPPPVFEGMREALEQLSARGMPLAIVTSLPGTLAIPMLETCNLKPFFPVVVHAGNCRVRKPRPESILKALAILKVTPSENVFYVGDRMIDAMAADRAGISAAWMRHGYEQPAADSDITTIAPSDLIEL